MADFTNPTNDELLHTFAVKDGDTLTTKNGSKWIWAQGKWNLATFGGPASIKPLAVTTTSDGGVRKGRAAAIAGIQAADADAVLFNSSERGRAAKRAGGRAVKWDAGTLTKQSSNAGEALESLTIDGDTWLKITPSTAAGATTVARMVLSDPIYFGNFKTLQIPLKFDDMALTEIDSSQFVVWFYADNGGAIVVPVNLQGQWPGMICVESFSRDTKIGASQPLSYFDLERITQIEVRVKSGTSTAAKAPVYIGPISCGIRAKGKVLIRLDGEYDSQHKYVLPMLEQQGLRANLHITTSAVGQAGRMKNAQLDRAYQWGHMIGHHTFGAKSDGWASDSQYPDAASVIADVSAQWSNFQTRGWTRGIGHTVFGFNPVVLNSYPTARQIMVRDALLAAGVKTVNYGVAYQAAAGGVGELFPYSHPQANWFSMTGAIMVTNTDTAATVQAVIDAAEDRGELAIIVIHRTVRSDAVPAALEAKNDETASWIEYLGDKVRAGLVDVPTTDEIFDLWGN